MIRGRAGETAHCHDIIVMGASLGGVETLPQLLSQLPVDFPAAVFIVQHTPSELAGLLNILDRSCPLDVGVARDGDPIARGKVTLAPPDRHLLLGDGAMRVIKGPRENGSRPAIDPLFRSAAVTYGPRVVGVVLSGSLDDGRLRFAGHQTLQWCDGGAGAR